MSNDPKIQETILEYILGKLSEDEKLAFEEKLESDPELRKELEIEQALRRGVIALRKQEIRNRAKALTVTENNVRLKRNRRRRTFIGLAAGILFFILIFQYFIPIEINSDNVQAIIAPPLDIQCIVYIPVEILTEQGVSLRIAEIDSFFIESAPYLDWSRIQRDLSMYVYVGSDVGYELPQIATISNLIDQVAEEKLGEGSINCFYDNRMNLDKGAGILFHSKVRPQ